MDHEELYQNVGILIWLTGPLLVLLLLPFPRARRHIRFALGDAIAACSIVTLVLAQHIQGDEAFGLVLLAIAGLVLNIGFLVIRRPQGAVGVLTEAKAGLALSIACVSLIYVGWSLVNIGIVSQRALAVAGQRPFCLQVQEGFGYRAVTRWHELMGHEMQSPYSQGGSDDYQWQFHAVLVVQGDSVALYNWSYWAEAFLPIHVSGMTVRPVCEPTVKFLATLT